MRKKLTKHGNSLALIIERSILDLLKINADTSLDISTDGQVLIITPIRNEKDNEKLICGECKLAYRVANNVPVLLADEAEKL